MRIREPPSGHGFPQCTIKVPGAGAKFSAALIQGGGTRLHGIQVQICATVRNLAHQRQFVKHCRQKNQKKGAERAAFIRSSAPGRLRHFATLPAASAAKCEEPGRKSVLAPSCRIRHASSPRPPQKALDDRAAGIAAYNTNPDDAAHRGPRAGKSGRASRPGARSAALPSGAICRRRDRRIPARRRPYAHRAPSCGRGRAPDTCGDQIPPACRGRPCGCRQSWPDANRSRC